MFVTSVNAGQELIDGRGLVAARLIVALEFEVHRRLPWNWRATVQLVQGFLARSG
jgi:hypothetical protein